mgnify:CR=1 FL=1
MKKRYAIVGLGYRGTYMFLEPMHKKYQEVAQLVALCDSNRGRAALARERTGLDLPIYTDYQQMLAEVDCDTVIVSTPDFTHHKVILASLRSGKDVICEKPMTIFDDKCREILAAEKETGKKVTVTFNCRFHPYMTKIKELVAKVGKTYSVELDWYLDTVHGADYFRRWHRYLKKSGGLLLHKSTHHFDVINWWLNSYPEEVSAFGTRRFYGPVRDKRGTRCLTCEYKDTCEFYWDIEEDPFYRQFYLEAEEEDNYIRDSCVFDESIDIYDSMAVNVKYQSGALLAYSLIAHSPYEGWNASISGTKGRMEVGEIYSGIGEDDGCNHIKVYDRSGAQINYDIPKLKGSHGGADDKLIRMLIKNDVEDDLGVLASSMDGAMSLLIGAAANLSIAENQKVKIKDLLKHPQG